MNNYPPEMYDEILKDWNFRYGKFSQLSSINPRKDKSKKVTMRPGFYADMLKTNQFNLLHQSNN